MRPTRVIFLMITNGEKRHYIIAKNLRRFLRGITPNEKADYYCLNCLYSFRTGSKLKVHENVRKDYDY